MASISHGQGTVALAAFDSHAHLKKHEFGRPEPGLHDVAIDIRFCGMCHSDCHACNGDWGLNMFPIVPGHEIAGIVRAVGSAVANFQVGDRVGVGCIVESCRRCELCVQGLEQHCLDLVQIYGSVFPEGKGTNFEKCVGYHTNGGYSSSITVSERFVFHIPDSMKLEYAGVLLCAGITVFSPLNRHILQKGGGIGKHVGIVGFGGLGHMGVKIAKAMGAEVTVLSRSSAKQTEAERLGARLVVHSDPEQLKAARRTFDIVLDTIAVAHDVEAMANTLKVGGIYVLFGAFLQGGEPDRVKISAFQMLMNRQTLEGSLIGGVVETQEMLTFCAENNIVPEYEIIHARDANKHFHAMVAGDVGAFRAVIDISTIKDI